MAMLLVAITGQAQDVIYERGNTTAWSDADLNDWAASYCSPTIYEGLNVSSINGGWTLTKSIAVTEGTEVTLTANLKTGGAGGRFGSYDYIKMGGVSIRFYEQDQKAKVDIDGEETEMSISYIRASSYTVTIKIDQINHKVSAQIGTAIINATSNTAITNVEFGHFKAGKENYGINPILQSIQITEEVPSTTYYDYTVKFVLENSSTELKAAEVRSGISGTHPTLTSEDKAMFTIDDVTYQYVSDDAADQTIEEDGSTVVTIFYKVAVPLPYQVVAVDGNNTELAVVAEGELYEGESTTAYYTKAVKKDGQWYMIAQNATDPYYGVTISGGQTINKTYSASDITWFSEAEDLKPSRSWAADGGYPDRYSNGAAKRLYKNSYAKTEAFTSGVYTVTLRARNNSSRVATLDLYLVDANGNLVEGSLGTFEEWTSAQQAEKSIENVAIPEGYGIALNNNTEYNSNLELDYLYLTRTGDLPPVEVTISQYGYSTLYYSDRNLAVPEGLTAYGVTVDGKKATLNDMGSVIPARTGVVLEGTPNKSYTLAVTSESGVAVENILKGTDETTEISEAGYKYYMLSVKGTNAKSIGFYYQVEGGISITNQGHRAYLAVESEPDNSGDSTGANGLPFFEQTDGISSSYTVNSVDGGTYTLTGIRVDDSLLQKGVYIRNGQKSIIK